MLREEKRYTQVGKFLMGIVIKHRGSFKNTENLFQRIKHFEINRILQKYGELGVASLSSATPIDSGKTASSWSYEIEKTYAGYSLVWKNSNINKNVSIALILQYGHGTGTGGYVSGIDYINPALEPVFNKLADEAWQEVTKG